MNTKTFGQIKTRRDFMTAFQEAMGGAHENLRSHWFFDKEQNLPKSYLVEFHPHYDSDEAHTHEWTSETVFSSLKRVAANYSARVSKTADPTLLILRQEEKDNSTEFVVDCLNPRF